MSTEEYHALWRSSAHEAVPYTDDFPEALLVLPELSDGSIGQGNATKVGISIRLDGEKSRLTVSDNGGGIRNERRLFQWAAPKATDNIHRNGHGTKKCLTKWAPEYTKAEWTMKWRLPGKNLQIARGPFKGRDTVVEEVENDEQTLMPSGCEISTEFNANMVLGPLATNSNSLFSAIKELIQTRYSEETLTKTEFIVDIVDLTNKKLTPHSSRKNKWHSFKTCVDESVKNNTVKKLHESRTEIDGGYYIIEIYYIIVDGKTKFALRSDFPKYGLRSMRSSRAHISLDGRMIEAIPIYQLLGLEANHNDYNGYKVFVNFVPNDKGDFGKLPVPCTTKVSLYENDPIYKAFVQKFKAVFDPVERANLKEIEKAKAVVTNPIPMTVTKKVVAAPVAPVAPAAPVPVVPVAPVVHVPVAPVPVVPMAPVPVARVAPAPVYTQSHSSIPSVIPVGGHTKLVPSSKRDLFERLIRFKEEINKLPLDSLRDKSTRNIEQGISQKIQALYDILEFIKN